MIERVRARAPVIPLIVWPITIFFGREVCLWSGTKAHDAKKLKELEPENAHLKHIVAGLALYNAIPKELDRGRSL